MPPALQHDVAVVRRFNRFYTRRIRLLGEGLLGSGFALAQARVIWELAIRGTATASELAADLDLDPGYLSRILRAFARQGLVSRERSAADRRRAELCLTGEGRAAFEMLDERSREEIAALLDDLDESERARLLGAMGAIEELLRPAAPPRAPFMLRPHRPGDLGWVVMRHAVRYCEDYGWDATFEPLVAEIAARFLREYDASRERCWIAEMDGAPVGSVLVANAGDGVAKLRLLLVEPAARGLGLGTRLVEECIRFARETRYHTLTLWTNDVLVEARRIYERAGFARVACEPHRSFGHDLVGETWELSLHDLPRCHLPR